MVCTMTLVLIFVLIVLKIVNNALPMIHALNAMMDYTYIVITA